MNEPVGHPSPEPNMEALIHSVSEVVKCARARDFTSKNFVHHVGDGIVQANAFRGDGPDPVFASDLPQDVTDCCDALEAFAPQADEVGFGNWWQIAQLLFQLISLIGKK